VTTLDTVQRHEIPKGWEWRKLGDICDVTDRDHRTPSYQEHGVPLISPRDFTKHGVDLSRLKQVAPEELTAFVKKCKPEIGDILYSRIGTIGEARLVDFKLDFVALHSIAMVKPRLPGLMSKFVLYLLQSPAIRSKAKHNIKSVGTPDLGLTRIRDFDVPVPPPEVQREIVAELEKQFSRLDEAVANLQRVKANLKRYKASVLKAAVEGRLVETEATLAHREGRSYETGELLLQRILEERRAKWVGKGKYKEPVKADAAGIGVVPEGWAIASLDMLSTDSGYGTSQKCGYENDGPVVLRIPNVQHGILDLHDLKYAPTEFKLSQSDAVSSGDMLIIRTNGSKSLIGRAAVVMAVPQRMMSFASYLIRFRLSNADCIPAWVSVVWQTSHMREWIEAHAATSAGQHNVSMTVLAKANIPVPPVAEQARIVAEVDRHLSIIREVEAEVDANLQRAQALRQATLSSVFGRSS